MNPRFEAAYLLEILRRGRDPSDFGYMIQGLFAHVLLLRKASIVQIKNQGHPDIVAVLDGVRLRVEIAVLAVPQLIDPQDVIAIEPRQPGDDGLLVYVDCGPPTRLLAVPHAAVRNRTGERLYPLEIEVLSTGSLSDDLTDQFADLLLQQKARLAFFRYHVLADWALRGVHIPEVVIELPQ